MQLMAEITVLQKRMSDMPSKRMYFGWGIPVYGGLAKVTATPMLPWLSSFLLDYLQPMLYMGTQI